MDGQMLDLQIADLAASLGDATRRSIYITVREAAEPTTANHIADLFDIHANVARHHLDGWSKVVTSPPPYGDPMRTPDLEPVGPPSITARRRKRSRFSSRSDDMTCSPNRWCASSNSWHQKMHQTLPRPSVGSTAGN